MKKIILSIAIALGLMASTSPLLAADVVVKDHPLQLDQAPMIENNRLLVPMRAIFEALGAKVEWNPKNNTIIATKEETKINLTIGSKNANINGQTIKLDVAPKIKNSRTLVPIRFVSENLGSKVIWEPHSQTVYIDSSVKATPTASKNTFAQAIVTRNIDGDTIAIKLNGQDYKLRMIGVDTPETHHPRKPVQFFGKEAAAYTAKVLPVGTIVYLQKDVSHTDRYGRLLRYVWKERPSTDNPSVAEIKAKMFNADLVMNGYARPYTYPPDVRYSALFKELSEKARKNRWGLWAAPEKTPVAQPQSPTPSTETNPVLASGEGLIKGNINRQGEKIYHVPGGASYNKTKAEQLFKTEAEAQAAGYRPAKR